MSDVKLGTRKIKRLYFIGIGGIAMANLACLLKQKGYAISGSDSGIFGPSKILLEENKIKFSNSYNPNNMAPFYPTMVVIGNAIGRGNPELEYVLNNNIPYCSMPEIIKSELLSDKKTIVIAGTSGKTTTTALMGWILHEANLKPTVLVGGTVKNWNSGFLNGNGPDFSSSIKNRNRKIEDPRFTNHASHEVNREKHVVLEGDEYNTSFYDSNPKFLHYKPYHAIITNIQPDHLDIYGNLENIIKAFKKLVKIIPSKGSLILNNTDPNSKTAAKDPRSRTVHFGQKGDIKADNIKFTSEGITFDVYKKTKKVGRIESPLLGQHNVENILAAVALALDLKIPFKKLADAMASFKGVKRRLDIIYENNDIKIIDDFAHNPDKVMASLSALRSHFPKHKIVAIFEPRTGSSRRKFFQDIYPKSFKYADLVYIADPFRKNVLNKKETLSSKKLAQDLNKKGIESYALKNADVIISHLSKIVNRKSKILNPLIIVVMTSGDFDGIHRKLIKLDKN